jgi:hypothetical protein
MFGNKPRIINVKAKIKMGMSMGFDSFIEVSFLAFLPYMT